MESSWHLWRFENGCSCPTFSWSVSGYSPLPGNDDDDTRGISDIINVPDETKEGDGDNDEFYVRKEEDDDDVEFRRNTFDVTTDDKE